MINLIKLVIIHLFLNSNCLTIAFSVSSLSSKVVNELKNFPSYKENAFINKVSDINKLMSYITQLEESTINNPPVYPRLWTQLEGEWKLIYSNNAGNNSPQSSKLFRLEKVTQRFRKNNLESSDYSYFVDNVLYYNTLNLSGEISLIHSSKVLSSSEPASLAIFLDKIEVKGLDTTTFPFDKLLSPSYLRKGSFETTFIDHNIRISRGQFGELRIFEKIA